MEKLVGYWLAQGALLCLHAAASAAETAVLAADEERLEELTRGEEKKTAWLRDLVRRPSGALTTAQAAAILTGLLAAALGTVWFAGPLAGRILEVLPGLTDAAAGLLAAALVALGFGWAHLVLGELVPRRAAGGRADRLAAVSFGFLWTLRKLLKPFLWLSQGAASGILRLFGADPGGGETAVSEEKIRRLVDAGSEKGTIDHEEKEFIQNVFEFDDLTAEEIATHRTEVVILWMEEDTDQWAAAIHTSRHTLYPVCDGSPDHVVGILNAKDYFRLDDRTDRQAILAASVKPAYFVPETIKADVLFRNMRKTRNTMAVVLDEYGGMSGIVTINDLLEELVGEFTYGPEDVQDPEICRTETGLFKIRGNLELAELEQATGVELETEEYDTLTGLVFDKLGQIPQDGKQNIRLTMAGLEIRVEEVRGHQIARATVRVLPQEPQA